MVGAATAGAEVMDIASLKRLLFDVFHEDVSLFKEYCVQVRGGSVGGGGGGSSGWGERVGWVRCVREGGDSWEG